jgi:hypothetical protein
MKGCVLFGRFVFSNPEKNVSRRTRAASAEKVVNAEPTAGRPTTDKSRQDH